MGKQAGWNSKFGEAAEQHAAALLRLAGLNVLRHRYRVRGGEIDLVARDGRTLVFVEVKARRSRRFGAPAEAVTRDKQRRLLTAARAYLREHPHHGPCRFDVIAIRSCGGTATSRWMRDAFTA